MAITVSFDDALIPLVDSQDKIIGQQTKLNCHLGAGVLHRAFSVFIFNSQRQLLMQQRSAKKLLWPQFWSNSCCSHPNINEDITVAAHRRLKEEVGLTSELHFIDKFEYLAQYQDIGTEHEVCSIFIGFTDRLPQVNTNEVSAIKYLDIAALDEYVEKANKSLTPWFTLEWNLLRQHHWAKVESLLFT